uniref:Uncharacterized protein n=1 Tax=Oryza meridionalis TaxID=40149 RepID=A0A0E0EN15_9ORYZ
MGCVSSKILSKSGSFQEKVVSHGFKGSNLIEEIILSTPKKSNGDQFLALLRTSTSSASAAAAAATSRAKDAADQTTTTTAAAAEEFVKIETINVSELLAGLEEEEEEEEERDDGERCSAQACVLDGAAARARSFRTVEEFDALVTQCGSSEAAEAASSADQDATGAKPSEQEEEAAAAAAAAGNKRRARARQLGELKVPLPPAFDLSKSGSLRDWLLQGGQIFSPGSYVTPKFGTISPAPPPQLQERGGVVLHNAGEPQPQPQQHTVFDTELVAQFEQAMERLSEDEERVLEKILEAMGAAAAAEEEEEATARLEMPSHRPVMVVQE